MKWIEYIRSFIETYAFGVCSYLGDKLRIPSYRIRIFFVYATFIATWSPLIIYLCLAFVLNLRNYIKSKRSATWDL